MMLDGDIVGTLCLRWPKAGQLIATVLDGVLLQRIGAQRKAPVISFHRTIRSGFN